MESEKNHWTKTELQIYILMLCANADMQETKEEIDIIKSKVDDETFNKVYEEFCADTQDESLTKIERNIAMHHYSHRELNQIRKEMKEVFFTDKNFKMMERNLERILNNMLY